MENSYITVNDKLNSMIGSGTRFKGEFELEGLLRIDGDFSGEIRTTGKVIIGSSGRVECRIHAACVIIGGMVRGDIVSTEKVIILATGMVIGNIVTPRLIIEEGVIFNGNCRITKVNQVEFKKNFLEKKREYQPGSNTNISDYSNDYKAADKVHDPEPVLIGK